MTFCRVAQIWCSLIDFRAFHPSHSSVTNVTPPYNLLYVQVRIPITTPSSRCLETGRSAITSKLRLSTWPGSFSLAFMVRYLLFVIALISGSVHSSGV